VWIPAAKTEIRKWLIRVSGKCEQPVGEIPTSKIEITWVRSNLSGRQRPYQSPRAYASQIIGKLLPPPELLLNTDLKHHREAQGGVSAAFGAAR
jgi:hypothetical protein